MASEDNWKYLIVEFPDEETSDGIPMAVISSRWQISPKVCLWPGYMKSTTQRQKAVLNHLELKGEKCSKCQINVKYTTDDYNLANVKLKKMELSQSTSGSNLSQNDLEIRKKTTVKDALFSYSDVDEPESDSDSSSLNLPTPPVLSSNSHFNRNSRKAGSTAHSSKLPQKKDKRNKEETRNNSQDNSDVTYMDTIRNTPPMTLKTNLPSGSQTKEAMVMANRSGQDNSEVLKTLAREVHTIKHDIRYLTTLVSTLLAAVNTKERVEVNDIEVCKNYEELAQLNTKLMNEEFFATSVAKLGIVGGKDAADTTRKILLILVDNSLAKELNWSGRNKKNGFEALQDLVKLINVAVRRNPLAKDATNIDINKAIMNWLRNAKDREGGRKQRDNKDKAATEENPDKEITEN